MHAPIDVAASQCEWFVAVTEVAHERHALDDLERGHVEAWQPTMVCRRRVCGRMVEIIRPLLSRYLFVRSPSWQLSEIIGRDIIGFLPLNRIPQAIDASIVDSLRERQEAGEFNYHDPPTPTDKRRHRRVLRSLRELHLWQDEALAA